MRFVSRVIAASLLSCSCASPPAREPAPAPAPAAPPIPPLVAPVAKPVAPPPPPNPCPSLGPNEVSEDETPAIAGTSGRTSAGKWLEARGVGKNAFRGWVRSHDPKMLEDFDADSLYDTDDACETSTVGDPKEDALVCTLSVRTSIMRYTAVAFVVRNKHIASVFEAGYSLPAMDWPDSSWLDLQIAFAADGLAVDVRDRAKPGSVLVTAPSVCRKYYADYLACEKAHQEGTADENVCPRTVDATGKSAIGHMSPTPPESPMGGGRIELKGCAEALPGLDELVKQEGTSGTFASEFRGDRAFGQKACKARGHYVWKKDRFVKAP